MEPLYRKIYIKSKDDLPKEDGVYFTFRDGVKFTHSFIGSNLVKKYFNEMTFEDFWLNNIESYLQPIEITEADIEAWALQQVWLDADSIIIGAKAVLNDEIKHIEP